MPRYFFNCRYVDHYVADEEGDDLVNIEAARDSAVEIARELMSEEVLNGIAPDGSQVEIADENGQILTVVPFLSTLRKR